MRQHKMMYSIVGVVQPTGAYTRGFFGRYVLNAWVVLSVLLFAGALYAAPSVSSDPYLVKEYPDGTKVKIRWSQIGRTLDAGATHGGPPTMRATLSAVPTCRRLRLTRRIVMRGSTNGCLACPSCPLRPAPAADQAGLLAGC